MDKHFEMVQNVPFAQTEGVKAQISEIGSLNTATVCDMDTNGTIDAEGKGNEDVGLNRAVKDVVVIDHPDKVVNNKNILVPIVPGTILANPTVLRTTAFEDVGSLGSVSNLDLCIFLLDVSGETAPKDNGNPKVVIDRFP